MHMYSTLFPPLHRYHYSMICAISQDSASKFIIECIAVVAFYIINIFIFEIVIARRDLNCVHEYHFYAIFVHYFTIISYV